MTAANLNGRAKRPRDRFPNAMAHIRWNPASADWLTVATPRDDPQVTLGTRRGELTLTAEAGDGRVTVSVPDPAFDGPSVNVPVNGFRLADVLHAYHGPGVVTVGYDTDDRPIVVQIDGCRCALAPHRERNPRRSRRSAQATR